ncbi:MAG: hypothetical protein HXX08_11355 [Chloroflexi bacterium]|uniref:Uncharacterized protein n=1 Tax=Candidatus Chlorohelix allophototropha TaxID=3003348 RepID=A0A8T7M3D9_9CHLR|nr:hypothetical protein [Chloroflexota bacterium]WJW65834.1 hypothetical protein OZ401_001613 [Chloroflexota bacterium L227-S17]
MAYGWFICPAILTPNRNGAGFPPDIQCGMQKYNDQIVADNPGAVSENWAESEQAYKHFIVKVRATQTTLDLINADTGFIFFTASLDSLITQSNAALTTLENKLTAAYPNGLGIPLADIQATFGSTGASVRTHTYRELLNFIANYPRIIPTWDGTQFVFDTVNGAKAVCQSILTVDSRVV